MAEERYRCAICGVAGVPAPGRVCPLHLRASEQRLLVSQATKPSAWVLGTQEGAAIPRAAVGREPRRATQVPAEIAEFELAKMSQRFFALLIDVPIAAIMALFFAAIGSANPIAATVAGLVGWWGYFLLSNSLGQLAGKATVGIKVIDPATGREPGLTKGTVRTMGQAIGLVLILALAAFTAGVGIILLMIAWNERNVTIDDAMAGTKVVRTPPARR
jgi:uncharacterized RDD family membrane protein YckC